MEFSDFKNVCWQQPSIKILMTNIFNQYQLGILDDEVVKKITSLIAGKKQKLKSAKEFFDQLQDDVKIEELHFQSTKQLNLQPNDLIFRVAPLNHILDCIYFDSGGGLGDRHELLLNAANSLALRSNSIDAKQENFN